MRSRRRWHGSCRPLPSLCICLHKQIYGLVFAESSKYFGVMTQDQPASPLTAEEEAAWRALGRAVLVIPRALDADLLESQGLNVTEYSVLMNLSEAPGRSLGMSELANYVSISVSGLTRVIERLTRQGLVERVRAQSDGRGQVAVLTPAGLDRLQQAWPTHLASIRRHVMDHLDRIDLHRHLPAQYPLWQQPKSAPPARRRLTAAS